MAPLPSPLRIGTRGSPLALIQANAVRTALVGAGADPDALEIVPIRTSGDRVRDRALAEVGGKGLFTKELETALAERHIDVAVHSMKDVPTWLPDGLAIAALLPREDPRDVLLVARRLGPIRRIADLPHGARVGTAALRRQAQLLHRRPDLRIALLRGNVETRLAKLEAGEVDATLLALAGLKRLGIAVDPDAILAADELVPAVAQGAIGAEVRADDAATRALVARLDDRPTSLAVGAERAMLAVLDGSCRTPIGGLAVLDGARLALDGLVATADGSALHRRREIGDAGDPLALGRAVGHALRAAAGPDFFRESA
ncbi:MAG TPA: hydroxymethylbilane synthase [Candidatus Sulfotelmatobacter sp.]|nr:hydroxymethylbilane synthase [Candidatus Sulfotelmatobacter sp.]